MPIMSMHDVRNDKTYASEKWLSLQELLEKAWMKFPKEPSFKSTNAVEKKKEEAPKRRWRQKKEEIVEEVNVTPPDVKEAGSEPEDEVKPEAVLDEAEEADA